MGDNSATGATLFNIFKNSEVKVLQLCLDYNTQRHNPQYPILCCDTKRSIIFYLFKSLYRFLTERGKSQPASLSNVVVSHKKSVIISFLQGVLDNLPKRYSPKAINEVDEFAPDIIYTLGENISSLKLSSQLSKKYDAPIVIHVMDDIESNIYKEGRLVMPFRRKYLRLLNEIYKNNRYHLAIGETMAIEFSRRHHCDYEFVMNCVERVYPSEQPMNDPLRMVFSGGLHGGRDATLMRIARLISQDDYLKKKFDLNIYTSRDFVNSCVDLKKNCRLHEYVPTDRIIENLSSSDILLHVESFDDNEIEYFKYSMSTKIPEYLSVGRPILGFGPLTVSSISYIRNNNVGRVAQNEIELRKALLDLCDPCVRMNCGETAIQVATDCHTSEIIKRRLQYIFNLAINNNNEE